MTFLFSLYLANLGGQMGLFLGASIVTLTELGEFVLCMVWLFFKMIKKVETKSAIIHPTKMWATHKYTHKYTSGQYSSIKTKIIVKHITIIKHLILIHLFHYQYVMLKLLKQIICEFYFEYIKNKVEYLSTINTYTCNNIVFWWNLI